MRVRKVGLRLPLSQEFLIESFTPLEPGHVEVTPKSPEWLAERELFAEAWEAMKAEGLRRGFLGHEPCYECGGELSVTTDVEDRRWVPDE